MSLEDKNRRQRRDLKSEINRPGKVKHYKLSQEELEEYQNLKTPKIQGNKTHIAFFKGGYRK